MDWVSAIDTAGCLRRNVSGEAVVRHKIVMSDMAWLPDDTSKAPRFLNDGVVSPFEFVVPTVLPVQALNTSFSKLEARFK